MVQFKAHVLHFITSQPAVHLIRLLGFPIEASLLYMLHVRLTDSVWWWRNVRFEGVKSYFFSYVERMCVGKATKFLAYTMDTMIRIICIKHCVIEIVGKYYVCFSPGCLVSQRSQKNEHKEF